jgi:hypothetical protein
VPRDTDLSAVTAGLSVSPGATLIDENLEEIVDGIIEGLDFTQNQIFVVQAQDGSQKVWTVKVVYDTSSSIGLNVELVGLHEIKFGFSYPNHIETGGSPDYTKYDDDIAYENGSLKTGNPIKLSYFVTDNAIYNGTVRKTYYNTLVVSAAGMGFTGVEWTIDGRAAPTNNSTETSYFYPNNILTIRAQDWTLENTHTVVFIGTLNKVRYSGTFEFKVVEQEPKEEDV